MNSNDIAYLDSQEIKYKQFVATLIKKYPENPNLALAHSAMGVSGEAGELVDAIKRIAIYEKEADILNIIEELGDLNFFMTDIQNKFGITDDIIILRNVQKLEKRYPKGYTDKAAQDRADKVVLYFTAASKEEFDEGKYLSGPHKDITEAASYIDFNGYVGEVTML